jgi:surface carbohydrate biosynthesis protein
MVVSIDSALAFEALGRGGKVAFISLRGEMFCMQDRRFGYPSELPLEGPFWTRSALKNELFDFLSDVYLTDENLYKRNVYAFKEILIPHNYGNTKLIDIIKEILEI